MTSIDSITTDNTKHVYKNDEECRAVVSKLNAIDDVFFQKLVEDASVCEEIIQTILENDKIRVLVNQPQKFLRNIGSKSIILDLRCIDENGNQIFIEVQKSDTHNHQKRVRYYISNLDTYGAEKGIDYADLKDIYSIYISKADFFQQGRTVYHVKRILAETGKVVYNGINEIYANTQIKSDSKIGQLMDFFTKSTIDSPIFPRLAARTRYFKVEQEGVRIMCDLVEQYAQKKAQEAAQEAAREANARAEAAENKLKKLEQLYKEKTGELPVLQ